MSTIHDRVSSTIVKKLLLILFLFYAFQYAVCMVIAAAADIFAYDQQAASSMAIEVAAAEGGVVPPEAMLRIAARQAKYSAGLLPFWHYDCGLGEGNVALASWLTLVLSQLFLIGMIFLVVRSTTHAWDYAVTISFIHFVVSCIATVDGPANWRWWVTLILSTITVVLSSTFMTYRLHDLRDIEKA
mmetsp:Transcript_31347/g.74498  ORF Transcript_31347/g.74498 Transcript_31347/m.74498 type:complete len:186 (-) Transcript_31347:49-606(-)